jgi:hypothetical protein
MFQAMSLRSSSSSRAVNTAVMIGEGILESIQSEGRQRMLFLRYAGTPPTTTFFSASNTTLTRYYAFDGTKLGGAAGAFYTVTIKPSDIISTSGSNVGGTKLFTLTISFTDVPAGVVYKRSVTLTRQVAYA